MRKVLVIDSDKLESRLETTRTFRLRCGAAASSVTRLEKAACSSESASGRAAAAPKRCMHRGAAEYSGPKRAAAAEMHRIFAGYIWQGYLDGRRSESLYSSIYR